MLVFVILQTVVLSLSLSNVAVTASKSNELKLHHPNPNMTGRILNGVDAQPGAWPFMVSLQYYTGLHYCGASVLNADTLLTAAHCMDHDDRPIEELRAYLGQVDITSGEDRLEDYLFELASYTLHPDWLGQNPEFLKRGNDVAIVKLARKIDFSLLQGVKKVCLPRSTDDLPDVEKCVAIGWGQTHTGDNVEASPTLKQVSVAILRPEQCPHGPDTNHDLLLCAGEKDKGSCAGDSGSPLLCPPSQTLDGDGDGDGDGDQAVWLVYGIASFTRGGCGDAPVFYTRVTAYVEWIKQQVSNSNKP